LNVPLLALSVGVLASINLNSQSLFWAVKIKYILANAVLSEELETGYLSVPQYAPQFSFSIRCILSQASSVWFSARIVIQVFGHSSLYLILS